MRNHYESEVGHFVNAITPDVETFRERMPLVENLLKGRKIKICWCIAREASDVRKPVPTLSTKDLKCIQLNGGIIEYARQVKAQGLENKFLGKNFVFDERLGERMERRLSLPVTNTVSHVMTIPIVPTSLVIYCLFNAHCAEKYHGCCSDKCSSFLALPQISTAALAGKMEFNGTKFGKGRYKVHRQNEALDIE